MGNKYSSNRENEQDELRKKLEEELKKKDEIIKQKERELEAIKNQHREEKADLSLSTLDSLLTVDSRFWFQMNRKALILDHGPRVHASSHTLGLIFPLKTLGHRFTGQFNGWLEK